MSWASNRTVWGSIPHAQLKQNQYETLIKRFPRNDT
nr:MAG TPA: hypothetical protein [Caudoviricetes sp.]